MLTHNAHGIMLAPCIADEAAPRSTKKGKASVAASEDAGEDGSDGDYA